MAKNSFQLKKFRFTVKIGFISAFFTIMLLLFLFRSEEIAPFGKQSLASRDASIQYLDFFSYLKNILTDHVDFFYTFSKHLGGTAFSLFTYYLSSPFNILVIFFKQEDLHIFFNILVLIKLSLSAFTCTVFLSYRLKNIKEIFLILLSVSYAFMQYNLA